MEYEAIRNLICIETFVTTVSLGSVWIMLPGGYVGQLIVEE